jgi:flagellar biosynthetic protein FliR
MDVEKTGAVFCDSDWQYPDVFLAMLFNVETAWLVAVLLTSIRFGTVFMMTPVFGSMGLPVQIRLMMVIGLSATLVSASGAHAVHVQSTIGDLALAGVSELLIGAIFSFGLFAGFGVFLFGGRLLDLQMGFGVASLFDPATKSQEPLLGTALNMLAVLLFFLIDGHHMIIRSLAYSLEKIPPGTTFFEVNIGAIIAQFGSMFVYGFALVAPVVFCLLLIDVGMAVMARTMPQLNIFILAMSVKIFVGLVVLAFSMRYMAPLMNKVFESIYLYWEKVLV